ncbi:hypothetical protein ACHQM5_026443 [Ranunculus cassubicifolius]
MPRARDIGWQHGKMIGGNSHHVQCNYCQRTMIGGITRFKKHLASKRGEIRGCEAVPKEVRELIKKHLADWRKRKASGKKKKMLNDEPLSESSSEDKDTEANESDHEMEDSGLESSQLLQHAELSSQLMINDQPPREFFDPLMAIQSTNEQGSARRRATDLGWDHGLMVNGDRQKIECKYCHKVILGGGISRLKQHLAGERGNIVPCESVPDDVKIQMQQHLGFKVLQRLKKHKESEKVKNPSFYKKEGNDDSQRSPKTLSARISNGKRRKKESGDSSPGRRKRQRKQSSIMFATPVNHLSAFSQENVNQADMAVAKFMYDAGVPLNAANSSRFQLMADAIARVGPGYKMPSCQSLRGDLLNKCVQEAGGLCLELRKSWEVTGCSVIADRWTDRTGRTVVNFYVYCAKGNMFLKSFDATEISKSSEELFTLFDNVVQDVGPTNIVHFMTDTTPNYKAAGKMLMNKYKIFFWSASSTHCIDIMLEEFEKIFKVDNALSKAKRLCRFIYHYNWLLSLLKNRTGGREIVKPGATKCMTNMLTLRTIVSLKDPLHQMFTSSTWMQSDLSKDRNGLEVADIVVDPLFWSTCEHILKAVNPLLDVLHLVDNEESPSLGFIYDAMEKAKKEIIIAFEKEETEYYPYLKIMDQIWEEELHSPLHAVAYYLNPCIFYSPGFSTNKLIQKGLLDCIEILEPNTIAQDMMMKQIPLYENAVGDFSRPVAIRGRESLPPATWWSLYAAECPELQRFAVRILSQTCSAGQRERNWTMFEQAHLKRTNTLDNLEFVHYNLRIQERQSMVNKSMTKGVVVDPTVLDGMEVDLGDWVEDSSSFGVVEVSHDWNMIESGDAICGNNIEMKMDTSNYSANEGSSEDTNNSEELDDL